MGDLDSFPSLNCLFKEVNGSSGCAEKVGDVPKAGELRFEGVAFSVKDAPVRIEGHANLSGSFKNGQEWWSFPERNFLPRNVIHICLWLNLFWLALPLLIAYQIKEAIRHWSFKDQIAYAGSFVVRIQKQIGFAHLVYYVLGLEIQLFVVKS